MDVSLLNIVFNYEQILGRKFCVILVCGCGRGLICPFRTERRKEFGSFICFPFLPFVLTIIILNNNNSMGAATVYEIDLG
jgi:hypothetical protein